MGGKHKGNKFENLICEKLSLFISNGNNVDLFQRSSNSGGRQTVLERKGIEMRNQAGDIALSHSDGAEFLDIFCLECKHYKDIGLWSIVTETKGNTIYGWWTIHLKKCKQVNRLPILITRQNNRPILMFFELNMTKALSEIYSFFPKISIKLNDNSMIFGFLFDEFLALDINKMNLVYNKLKVKAVAA